MLLMLTNSLKINFNIKHTLQKLILISFFLYLAISVVLLYFYVSFPYKIIVNFDKKFYYFHSAIFLIILSLIFCIFYLLYRNKTLDITIQKLQFEKLIKFLIYFNIVGVICTISAKWILYFELYQGSLDQNNITCIFSNIREIWLSNDSVLYQSKNTFQKNFYGIVSPTGVILINFSIPLLFLLIFFSENYSKKYFNYILLVIIFAMITYYLSNQSKIILVSTMAYSLTFILIKFSIKKINTMDIFVILIVMFISLSLIISNMYLRSKCSFIVAQNSSKNPMLYNSDTEFNINKSHNSNNEGFNKDYVKTNFLFLGDFNKYLANTKKSSHLKSGLNIMIYYLLSGTINGENLLSFKHDIKTNHILLKELFNSFENDLNKIGINFNLIEIDKLFYERNNPISLLYYLDVNYGYLSNAILVLVFTFFIPFFLKLLFGQREYIFSSLILINFILFLMIIILNYTVNYLLVLNFKYTLFTLVITFLFFFKSCKFK